jgi:hypothetical protein
MNSKRLLGDELPSGMRRTIWNVAMTAALVISGMPPINDVDRPAAFTLATDVATHPWTGVTSDKPVKVVTPRLDPAVMTLESV